MNTALDSERMTSLWRNFLETSRIERNEVREEIAESWLRCKGSGVDPHAPRSCKALPPPLLDELLRKKKELIEFALPFMQSLYRFVAGSGFVVLLCDERGYLMRTVGDDDVLAGEHGLNLKPGALWTEEEVGNNGVGTALVLRRPFQVSGAEHYCLKHHPWTCSGAPIIDENDAVVGVLEMSGPVEKAHLHTLGMVVGAVEAIRRQLMVQSQNRELLLLNDSLNNIFLTVSDGVIVVDAYGTMKQVNPVAERLFGRSADEMRGRSVHDFFERPGPIREMLVEGCSYSDGELVLDTASGPLAALVTAKPLKDEGGKVTGGVLFINPLNAIKNFINRFSGAHATFTFDDIVGRGEALHRAIRLGKLVAGNESNVLLYGESGTGKEMLAQAIHNGSARRGGPFIAVNCGAIPRELIASELFGYAEGAFTGAYRKGRPGKFELASGGTLFLDEIGDMPLEQQVALLRVLQDKKIMRIGGDKIAVVDARIICATNKDLKVEVAKGNFRQDLYYRLNVMSIMLPPLREHSEDIPLMFEVLSELACRKLGRPAARARPEVIDRLERYGWPGNVREFQNVVERMVNISSSDELGLECLPEEIAASEPPDPKPQKAGPIADERQRIRGLVEEQERGEISLALYKNKGSMSGAAREMGMARSSLYRKMRRLGMAGG
jgi:sigma-54 dependent transcriptional regulator, acetoin dehydrogenase operon transcriptional activator AcoR